MRSLILRMFLIIALALSINPPAFAADTSAPVLVDWKLIDLKTDISNGDGILRIQFSVSDESDISEPLSNVGSVTTTQQTGFAFPKLVSKVGNISTYTAEATVKFGQAPGVWRWLFFPMRDVYGNSSQGFGPGGNWPINVWVYDKDFTEAKRLAAEAETVKVAEETKIETIKSNLLISYSLKLATLKSIKDQASKWFVQYPSVFTANPELKVNLMRAINYKILESPTQTDIDELDILVGGDVNRWGLLTAKTQAEALIAKQINLDIKSAKESAKVRSITCIKGKLVKKVTAANPVCPKGYKKK